MPPARSRNSGSEATTTGPWDMSTPAKFFAMIRSSSFAGNAQGRHIREPGPKGCLLVTVGPDQRIEPVFHRLDQVRWERGTVDISEVDTESGVLGRTAAVLDGLLAMRIRPRPHAGCPCYSRRCDALHDRLHVDAERLKAEIRSLATERGGDRLWIERVELQTRIPRVLALPDGPFEELLEVVELLRSDPASMSAVVDELAELKRKLPAEFFQDPDGPRLDQVAWLQTLLVEVQPLLLDS